MGVSVTTDLLTVDEAAQELRLHRVSVYRAIASGQLEAVRLGTNGRLRVRREAVDKVWRPAKGHRP